MRIELSPPRPSCRLTSMMLVMAVFAVCCTVLLPATAEAGSIKIDAWTFDRGNAMAYRNPDIYADYRDKYPEIVVGGGGQLPWSAEYDIDFPADGQYTLKLYYSSPEARPMDVWLGGKKVATFSGRKTGNPGPYPDRHPQHDLPRDATGFHGLEWEEVCKLAAKKGKQTLKFTSKGLPPRLNTLQLDTEAEFPKDWKPTKREPNLVRMAAPQRRVFLPADAVNIPALRPAIEDMIAEYGSSYPNGPRYLKQLAELEKKQAAAKNASEEEKERIEAQLYALRQKSMVEHPSLKFDKLLFVTQKSRYTSTYTGHLTRSSAGGNLCVLSPVSPNGKVTKLVPELEGGVFGRFDLSFDATKIVFCHSKEGETFRLYEIDIDPKTGKRLPGESFRQLAYLEESDVVNNIDAQGAAKCGSAYDDVDPCYLPNGQIMFASTRCERSVLCFPATVTSLHIMDADGSNVRCISKGQVNEISPIVLHDGRVVYMRWEYVDKGFGNVQSLWLVRPDGSGSDHVHKNNLVRPGAMTNARSIPGSRKLVAIAAGHHGGLSGPVIVIDNRLERRSAKGVTNITPELSYPGMGNMPGNGGRFKEPYPFSEKFFLVAHKPGNFEKKNPPDETKEPKDRKTGHEFGIYTLDKWGNRAELYRDPDISCFQPTPLRPRQMPTVIRPVYKVDRFVSSGADTPEETGQATMFLADVYRGLKGVKRGSVKYIRVMEAMNLCWEDAHRAGRQGDGAGMQASAVSFGGDVARKKVYGVATVYEDGSAYFTVPTDRNIFFQALDENYMELQRMRTFINLMPGEQRSCVGCHEVRRQAPSMKTANPIALDHPLEPLKPQPGDTGPRTVHYARDIQPILDKNCVSCHSGEKPKGELDLSGELTTLWSRSYENLTRKGLVNYLHTCGYGSSCVPLEPPTTFGSHRSPMVERIRKAPCKSNITREDFIKIVTWIDANAPYYGTHDGKKNLKWKSEPDFRPLPLAGK